MKDSIFKFDEVFSYHSPFGDWGQRLAEQQQAKTSSASQNASSFSLSDVASDGCISRLILTDVVEPANNTPGSANLIIYMRYRVVTSGEGAVTRLDMIRPADFRNLYAQGNDVLKLRTLPIPASSAQPLTSREERQSNKLVRGTNHPRFWNYYQVAITYDFELDASEDFTLWEGIDWVNECPETHGLFYLIPFQSAIATKATRAALDLKAYKKILSKPEKQRFKRLSKKDQQSELDAYKVQAIREVEVTFLAKALSISIQRPEMDYANKHLVIEDAINARFRTVFQEIVATPEVAQLLNSIGAVLHPETRTQLLASTPTLSPDDVVVITGVDEYVNGLYSRVMRFSELAYKQMSASNDQSKIGAAGSNPSINIPYNLVILNHRYFGPESGTANLRFGRMTSTEILVHEAGHNLALAHTHANDSYRYTDEGLSSNQHNKVAPTTQNTLDIINDETNRRKMTINR